MDAKKYERVTNASILLAVVCALLFERVGGLRWLTGALAIVAGVVAVVVYFINQSAEKHANTSAEQTLLSTESSPPKVAGPTELTLNETEDGLFDWKRAAQKGLHDRLLQQHAAERRAVYYLWRANLTHNPPRRKMFTGESESSRFVEDVVAIVRRLCVGEDPGFEFTIARDGSFTIRTTKKAFNPEELVTPEEEAIVEASPKPN